MNIDRNYIDDKKIQAKFMGVNEATYILWELETDLGLTELSLWDFIANKSKN